MPWTTPTLAQCRQMVRDDITAAVQGAVVVGNSVLRVICDMCAGAARLVLKYLDWLALQLMPDTAEKEWLDRFGNIWLVNADGTTGRKGATSSQGIVQYAGTPSIFVGNGTLLMGPNNVQYETLEDMTIDATGATNVAVRAISSGTATNLDAGTTMAQVNPIPGVATVTVVDLRGGTDEETDDQLRARVLQRIQKPPMGGDADDYVAWAEAIPSVTRAWAAPREMGMGTVTVRFMCDALRADNAGFPLAEDVQVVFDYMDKVRPVAVRDFWVQAPIPEPIDFTLDLLSADSTTLRAQVAASVSDMLTKRAAPASSLNGELIAGTTIYASWVGEAIARVTDNYVLTMDDHPMPHNGALAVLGTITYPSTLSPQARARGLKPTVEKVNYNPHIETVTKITRRKPQRQGRAYAR